MARARTAGIVYGLYAANAPNLIDPSVFGGVGEATARALRGLEVPPRVRPDAIVVSSPHWESGGRFLVHATARPPCIHDFYGFPRQLYAVRYDAPGEPDLAAHLVEAGKRHHLAVEATADWGLDHGAWATLLHVAPTRSTPVVPLSISALPAEEHLAWGRAIRDAVNTAGKRVAFVATGSITHRLDMFNPDRREPWPEGDAIEQEIVNLLLARRFEEIVNFDPDKWATIAPEGDLKPLFTMLGALGPSFAARLVAREQVFGSVSLTTIEWLPED